MLPIRLKTIDSLRGIVVLGVLAIHIGQSFPSHLFWVNTVSSLGGYGVQLFFIASAFTMAYMWDARSISESRPVLRFYIRRFFRIAPMFYLAAILYLVMYGLAPRYWAPEGLSFWDVGSTFLFLQGFWPTSFNSVVPGGWSIAAEVIFYLIFPALYTAIEGRKFNVYYIFLLSCILAALFKTATFSILADSFQSNFYLVEKFFYYSIFNQLPVFVLGIVAYKNIRIFSMNRLEVFYVCIGLTIYATMSYKLAIASVGLTIFLWTTVKFFEGTVDLGFPQIGKLSYSIYLLHFSIIELLLKISIAGGNIGFFTAFLIILISSSALSFIAKKFVEDKSIAFGTSLVQKIS